MFKDLIRKIIGKTKTITLSAARHSSGEFLLKRTDFGLVRAEFSVVEKIAERALKSVAGISESQVVVEKFSEANPLKISLTLTLSEGYGAPKVSEEADKAINGDLRNFLGLDFYVPIDVKVRQIKQVSPAKRRVR